jgi:hypothetical protein
MSYLVNDEQLVFNGINAASGGYRQAPRSPQEILQMALSEYRRQNRDQNAKAHVQQLERRHWQRTKKGMGVIEGVDTRNMAETGWGIIFAAKDDDAPRIREALQELLDHRREQAAQSKEQRYHEYLGFDGYQQDESGVNFLARHEASVTGPVNPDRMPYYLLVVGDPARLPFRFQYELDVQHAVGRIHFETLDEYAHYARSVVQAELEGLSLPRRAAFFGVANADDRATRLSAENLVKPLVDMMSSGRPDWTIEPILKGAATKARLERLLGGDETPALLFTASHGVAFPNGDEYQLRHQGALLCQQWPGPVAWPHGERITPEYYFSADDVGDNARLLGLLTFHFACFGAGTPHLNDFAYDDEDQESLAPHPFVARLPQRLLAHPQGGALAAIGHVDQTWGWSYSWPHAGQQVLQLDVFESTLKRLMKGYPVGSAMEYFNDRYGALSTFLTSALQDVRRGKVPDAAGEMRLASLWVANNDARSYVILGDPAVRLLAGAEPSSDVERPVLSTIHLQPEIPAGVSPAVASGDRTALGSVLPADALAELTGAVRELVEKLGQAVEKVADQVATVEVATYDAVDMAQLDKDDIPGTANLRAVTRIKADGNVEVCVPSGGEEVDERLWAVHTGMVERIQASRIELIRTVAEVIGDLLDRI